MKVTIVCFGVMREFLPENAVGNEVSIQLPDGATIGDATDELGAPRHLVHAALVNEDPAGLTKRLNEGDRLTLMPHYSGGRT